MIENHIEKSIRSAHLRGSQIPSPKPLVISLLAILIVCFTIFFTVQLVLHYRSFASRSLDLGNMNQAIWNTLHGRPFHQTNQPGVTNRLSLHVEPILIPISWLYLIYSTPEILFLLQAIVVALGAIPIFALARWKLRNHKLEVCDSWYDVLALLFAFVYLMYPPLQGATLLDFHAVTLAPTFLLATFYYLETRRPIHFAIFAMLAMACKEEISLLIMMMGLYALLIHRQYRWGLVTIILSLTWAYLAVFAIPPMFAGTENQHWNRYQHLGESPIDMVLNIFRQPMLYINHLKSIQAIEYIGFLLMPIAYLALLNPIPLLLGLPSLGINLLSSFPAMQEVNRLIYVAPIVPSVMIASIYGTSNLLRFIQKTCRTGILPVYVVRTGCPHSMIAIGLIILMATVMYHADYGYFPGGGQFRGWEKVTAHHQKAYRIFEQIPPDAKLSAHDRLDPHVSQRETIYIFDLINDADHIVLDVTASSWPLHPIQLQQRVTEFLNDDFGIVSAWDGYLLLARNRSNLPKTLPDKFYDFARIMDIESFQPQYPTSIVFADKIRLLGYDLGFAPPDDGGMIATFYWQALQPLEHDYALYPFFMSRDGTVIEDTSQRPLVATIWYPTSQWKTDEIIITHTLPRELGEQFTIAVGVTKENWLDEAQRLSITHADDELYLYENRTWGRLGTVHAKDKSFVLLTPQVHAKDKSFVFLPHLVMFGDVIHLMGIDFPNETYRPGETMTFSLYWQATSSLTIDLTNFVHVLNSSDKIVTQLDWQPQDSLGYLPTTSWQPNHLVVDSQSIKLPSDLPVGSYRLILGWYYNVTGERIPLTTCDSKECVADVVEMGTIKVK